MSKKDCYPLRPECCTAESYMDKLGYGARSHEAHLRIKAQGHRQTYCAVCLLCRWPEEQKTCPRFVRSEELEAFYEAEYLKAKAHAEPERKRKPVKNRRSQSRNGGLVK